MKLYDKGAYLLNGTELVEDGRDAADIIKSRTGETITSSEAAKNTIAYGILKEHNTSGSMEKLQIMGWSYAFSAFMDNTLAASRGLGKSAVPMAIVILGSCVFRVIWVYTIFAMFHTLTALYLLYIFSWSLTAIGQMIYFFRTYHKQTDGWEVPQTA